MLLKRKMRSIAPFTSACAARFHQTVEASTAPTRGFRMALLLAPLVLLPIAVPGQGPKPATPKSKPKAAAAPAPVSSGTHELTPEDVGAFLDGIVPQQLLRDDIAGAVVAVVKDGKLIYAQGYGYSDVEKKTPVSADATLFRPGSISKLFTWTAVMQLVEQGKLDLDHDVNEYLDFKVPQKFGKPITLRNIMTHTPGLEETIEELFVRGPEDLTPLSQYLPKHFPERIFPPGTTPAYSNFATTLAGYIVQRVSGQNYDDYIEQHILQPLAMNRSTFRQPLPPELAPMMSKGYSVASQPPKHFEYVEMAPAGSSSLTASDITHFMIAHLQDGEYEGTRILKPETAQLMHSRQFENLPQVSGMALGFYEETRNGHRIIGHGGDTELFHSDLHLVLDQQLGFFVSYNSAGKGEVRNRELLWHAFLDRYFPYKVPDAQAVSTTAQDVQLVSGHYIVSRRSESNFLKVLTVAGELKISPNDDGTISTPDLKEGSGEPKKFREIAPLLFRDVNGQDLLGFKRDASGNITAVIDFPFMVFQKASWYENSAFHLPMLIVGLSIMVLALIFWPVAAILRKHYGKPMSLGPRERRLRLLTRIDCILYLVFFASFAGFLTMALKDIGLLAARGVPWLHLIQLVGWVAVLGSLVAFYNAIVAWRDPARWIWSRIGEALIALACVAVIWFAFTWNLLRWVTKF